MTNAKKHTAAMNLLRRARLMVSGRYRIPWKADAATVQELLRDGLIDDGGYLTDAGQEALASREPAASVEDGDLAWFNEVRTGKHPDVTLHSGAALFKLEHIASRLASQPPAADALVEALTTISRTYGGGAVAKKHRAIAFAALAKLQGGGEQ